MRVIKRKINNKLYYYLEDKYRINKKTKQFYKYLGVKKPTSKKLKEIETNFQNEIIKRLSNTNYFVEYLTKKDLIKSLLFNEQFIQKYNLLTPTKKRKYNIDSIVHFTLTTLTTEDVDVNIKDVQTAFKKRTNLSQREQISKNMIDSVNLIHKDKSQLSLELIKKLHKTAMSEFETKTPGLFRTKGVHILVTDKDHPLGRQLNHRIPLHGKIIDLLKEFIEWYNTTNINPIEKSAIAHYKLYKIHPFLDGNKRICRLIFNKALIDNKFPLVNISDKKGDCFHPDFLPFPLSPAPP